MSKDEQGATDAGTRAVQARAAEIKIDLARWIARFEEADSIPLSVALLETGVDLFLTATTDRERYGHYCVCKMRSLVGRLRRAARTDYFNYRHSSPFQSTHEANAQDALEQRDGKGQNVRLSPQAFRSVAFS